MNAPQFFSSDTTLQN